VALPSPEDLPALVAEHAHEGDVVICLGAGTITAWANALPKQLDDLAADGSARMGDAR